MLTIDPPPAAFIGSITAFMPSQQPTALTSRIRRKSASGMSAMLANFSTPALLTSTSSRPKTSGAVATAAAQSASEVTSWCTYRQESGPRPSATWAPRSSSTSPNTTRAPSATKWRTCDLPMPRAPPVIRATLPSSLPMVSRPATKRLLGPSVSLLRARAGDPVEEQPQEPVHDLAGAVAATVAPLRREPQHVPEQPVGELRVQIGAEHARLDAPLELGHPDPLELAQGLAQVAEPGLHGEVTPVVLQHGQRGPVPGQRGAGRADDLLEHGARVAARGDRLVVVGEDLVDEAGQDLV